jgi:hypothetical protein
MSAVRVVCQACGEPLVEREGRCAACDVLIDHEHPARSTGAGLFVRLGLGAAVLAGVILLLLLG